MKAYDEGVIKSELQEHEKTSILTEVKLLEDLVTMTDNWTELRELEFKNQLMRIQIEFNEAKAKRLHP